MKTEEDIRRKLESVLISYEESYKYKAPDLIRGYDDGAKDMLKWVLSDEE